MFVCMCPIIKFVTPFRYYYIRAGMIRVIVTQGTPSLKSIAKDKDYNCIVERSRCINVT